PVEEPEDSCLNRDVECRRRFVGEQQARATGQRDRNRDALAHPAGELVRVGVQRAPRARDAHLVEQFDSAIVGRAAAEPEVAAHVLGQLLPDGEHRMKGRHRVLEDHPDVASRDSAQIAALQAQQILSSERRASLDDRAGWQQAEQCEHRHRLAAAALTRHAEDLCGLDVVVDAVDDGREAPRRRESDSQALDLQQSGQRSSPPHEVWGSKKSRRLSPRKLNASTTVKIASPGKVPIHHHWKYWVPSATIDPHSAVGGWAPRPRNERPERSRIAFARSSVASTITGPATFGRTSRNNARRAGVPISRADCTNSESPTESTRPRTTRAYDGQATTTIASAAFCSPRP